MAAESVLKPGHHQTPRSMVLEYPKAQLPTTALTANAKTLREAERQLLSPPQFLQGATGASAMAGESQ